MTRLVDTIKKEFTKYRQTDILWRCIKNDEVAVRITYYNVDDNTIDFGYVSEDDKLPIVSLEMKEEGNTAKRKDVTSKQMYFHNNSMHDFCRTYGKKL